MLFQLYFISSSACVPKCVTKTVWSKSSTSSTTASAKDNSIFVSVKLIQEQLLMEQKWHRTGHRTWLLSCHLSFDLFFHYFSQLWGGPACCMWDWFGSTNYASLKFCNCYLRLLSFKLKGDITAYWFSTLYIVLFRQRVQKMEFWTEVFFCFISLALLNVVVRL